MRPAVRAALDQAGAASSDALALFRAIGRAADMREGDVDLDGPVGDVLAKLVRRAVAGELSKCEHLRPNDPAHWFAARPSKLRCPGCLEAASLAVRGTREDHVCDACRKHQRRGVYPQAVQIPPVVVDLGDGPPLSRSPITLTFGLCPRCHRAAGATTKED